MLRAGATGDRALFEELMEKIDLNGSSVVADKIGNVTLAYMVGIGELFRMLQMPFAAEEPADVTTIIRESLDYGWATIAEMGAEAIMASEKSYEECRIAYFPESNVGLWAVNEDQPFDPSRPYEDGARIVVVYRSHYSSISIYGNAALLDKDTDFRKMWHGMQFAGHALACGQPREILCTKEDAIQVAAQLDHYLWGEDTKDELFASN